MPEYIKATINSQLLLLEKQNDGKWSKQIRAPDMPGEYKIALEVGLPEGGFFNWEAKQNIVVTGKLFDLGKYGKLSERLIKRIILTYYGCASHVLFENSTVRILVRMACHDEPTLVGIRNYILPKIPAHLKLIIERYPITWGSISHDFNSWNSVREHFQVWQKIYDYMPRHLMSWRDLKHEFSSWLDAAEGFCIWKEVMFYHSSDYAIWNEIKTCNRTWADLIRKYNNWDEMQIYMPVEPLKEGL